MNVSQAPHDGFDVVIVGGGLAGQLCALALHGLAPRSSVALVERAPRLGGNHTWCCHLTDLAGGGDAGEQALLHGWFLPLADVRWPGHRVVFPTFERVLDGEYLCLRSSSLAHKTEAALARPGCSLVTGQDVVAVDRHSVTLADGQRLTGRVVLDARGGELADYQDRAGFQKFLGWEIELGDSAPASLAPRAVPTLMDASVAQVDGFRFVYTLPFSSTRLLVEDTYFSRHSALDQGAVRQRLQAYLAAKGIFDFTIVREESGVLPMPWAKPRRPHGRSAEDALAIGYRGGFFHPGTGYSLGRAAVVACRVAELARAAGGGDLGQSVRNGLERLRARWAKDDDFGLFLNRLAFGLVPPTWLREHVFSPVNRLPQATLERFYAGCTSVRDRLAIGTAPTRLPFLASFAGPTPKRFPLLGENP
jgi:lycopene beta-cyclase